MNLLPFNVIDSIVMFSSLEDRVKLAQVDQYFKHSVYHSIYNTITIVDGSLGFESPKSGTVLPVERVFDFASCLTPQSFRYINKIVVNTHNSEGSTAVRALAQRVSMLWNFCNHVISFLNYDILCLRANDSINNFLESSSYLLADFEESDCIVTKRDHKLQNLRNWFMFDVSQLLNAPESPNLQRLSFYVESNAFSYNPGLSAQDIRGMSLSNSYDAAKNNILNVSELFLHSPLSFINFMRMCSGLQLPQLHLRRLCITSSHRRSNDAVLDFKQVNQCFDLNSVEELELRLNCLNHHECQDSCMVKFFDDWKTYNAFTKKDTNIRKLSLVHHKSATDTTQFKRIIENYVFRPQFSGLESLFINLSNTVRSPEEKYCIDLQAVVDKLQYVPNLHTLHISSFMGEWLSGLPQLLNERNRSYLDVLLNRCSCDECNVARAKFVALAELDKCNNYTHKAKLADVTNPYGVEQWVDFSKIENIKFLQHVTGVIRKEELAMERNLSSSGTMMDMENMLASPNKEVDPFKHLLVDSCLQDVYNILKSRLPNFRSVNFGGVVLAGP